MATFNYEISTYTKSDGTRNVIIRIYHNREKKYPPTNLFVSKDDLTKSLKLKNQKYIDLLESMLKKCRERCNDYIDRIGGMNIDQVTALVIDIIQGKPQDPDKFDLDFIEYGRQYITKLNESGREGNARTYEIAINNLVKYINNENKSSKEEPDPKLSIHSITSKYIRSWIEWITKLPAPANKVKGSRAESLYPSNIRALHNIAKKEFNDEEAGIIRIPLSPFKSVELPKIPTTRKRALPAETIKAISELSYIESTQPGVNRFNLAKDIFLLSFYLIGMNSADLFNCTHIKDGRITYERTKTKNRRSDRAEISIKIELEALAIIEKYRDKTKKRVFCFYQMYKDANIFNYAINKGLKKIGALVGVDDLEFYAARHSWATIARNKCKYSKEDVHEFINHASDDKMKVTDIYIEKDYSLQDEANRKVLDFIK